MKKKLAMLGVLALTLGAIGGGVAAASGGGGDSEVPITGDELTKATDAALAHTGEGKVTDTEVGDEESYYEVEVTLEDGSEVDVQLDRDFNVVGTEAEIPGEPDDDDSGASSG